MRAVSKDKCPAALSIVTVEGEAAAEMALSQSMLMEGILSLKNYDTKCLIFIRPISVCYNSHLA